MSAFKKLLFAPVYLILYAYFLSLFKPFLGSTDFLFNFSLNNLITTVIMTGVMILGSYFFVVFASLAQDWRYVLPVILIASVEPLLIFPYPINLVLGLETLAATSFIFTTTLNKLNNYLTFQPASLLSSSVRNLALILIFITAIAYYITLDVSVKKNGIPIPNQLLNLNLGFSPQDLSQAVSSQNGNDTALLQQQLNALGQNPQLLQTNTKALDALNSQISLKQLLQTKLKPYTEYIAPIMSFFYFSEFASLLWIMGFGIPLLIWLLFWLLSITGFIKFDIEMRQVKKMVV